MTEKLGDRHWMDLLKEHNEIIRRHVREHDGFEVKSEGDGFMLAFRSASQALHCAIGIQRDFATRNETTSEQIRVRMGLHTGDVIKEAGDFFGKNVILAARIAGQAAGGEILASGVVKAIAESVGDFVFTDRQERELKGLTGKYETFEVTW
jgi:class 3 adenylate cyclase